MANQKPVTETDDKVLYQSHRAGQVPEGLSYTAVKGISTMTIDGTIDAVRTGENAIRIRRYGSDVGVLRKRSGEYYDFFADPDFHILP